MNLESDAQVYSLNWISRLDRRNVELSAYCTVDAKSRFVLGMHANIDDRVDPFEVNAKAAANGEMQILEPFREHAHYWLASDELGAGRGMGRGLRERRNLIARVQEMYRHAASRSDVENVELQHFDASSSYLTPDLKGGLQVHMAYTTYAHWFLIRRILAGGGTKQVQASN